MILATSNFCRMSRFSFPLVFFVAVMILSSCGRNESPPHLKSHRPPVQLRPLLSKKEHAAQAGPHKEDHTFPNASMSGPRWAAYFFHPPTDDR